MDSNNKKTKCPFNGNRYKNPWNNWPFGVIDGPTRFAKWLWSLAKMSHDRSNIETDLPIKSPYFVNNEHDIRKESDEILATWLGHASVLVEMDGFRILCDPVFGTNCPPYVGPKRYRDAPCEVKDLPKIDAVLISHNHFDHMDHPTITELSELQSDIHWLIPKGDKANLERMLHAKSKKVEEMEWWKKHTLENINEGKKLDIYFTPTQHWSNRGIFDSFKSLWGSWALIGSTQRFWFGGDTGYCDAFKEIGEEFGPFDGAAIPIGAYEPRDLTKFQHVNPEEAIQIHKDIKSKVSFGIHWGTFQLTAESYLEPKNKLYELVNYEKEKMKENKTDQENSSIHFITINHGETLEITKNGTKLISYEKKNEENQSTWYKTLIYWLLTFFFSNSCNQRVSYDHCEQKLEITNKENEERNSDKMYRD